MGYLTTITIHNDALHSFEEDPKKFAEAIFEGIIKANRSGKSEDIGFKGYCNYIQVHPSHHADDCHLYVHYGNTVELVNGYSPKLKELCKKNPDYVKSLESVISRHLKELRKIIKDCRLISKIASDEDSGI